MQSDGSLLAAEQQPLLPADCAHGPTSLVDEQENDNRLNSKGHGPLCRFPSGLLAIEWRVGAAMFSFFVLGMHIAAIGVLLPHLETYYSLNDTTVALIFLTPLAGYLFASTLNSTIHTKFGRRGIATISPICHLLFTSVASLRPPYAVILLAAAISGFGTGLVDAGWCAWAGGMPNANTISGFLHGSYSLGATLGPYVATFMLDGSQLQWYTFYYLMIAACASELIVLTWAFRHDDGAQYRSERVQDLKTQRSSLKTLLRHRVMWICALYFLAYVGAEAAVAGWIITFMLRIRSASAYISGMCASGFWAGMAAGRLILGFATDRFGERSSVTVYLALTIILEGTFSLVRNNIVSVITITLLGFFLGPLFPTGIVMVTRILPQNLHVSAVAAVAAVGQIGGAIFPFALGAIAQRWGIQVLRPSIFVLLLLALLFWLSFPQSSRKQRWLRANREQDTEATEEVGG